MSDLKQQLRLFADKGEGAPSVDELLDVGASALLRVLPDSRGDEDKPVRWSVAMLLTYPQLRDESAVDALCEMLRDKYPSVRTVAARALSGIPRARAAEPLLQALEAERNPKVIAYMVGALASIGDARAIEPIETLLSLWVIEERGSPWIIRDFERALERALERLKNPQRHP